MKSRNNPARARSSSPARALHFPLYAHALPARRQGEAGNIMIFGLGTWLVAAAAIIGLVLVGILHIARQDLLAQADSIAVSAANLVPDAVYYGRGAQTRADSASPSVPEGGRITDAPWPARLAPPSQQVRQLAEQSLGASSGTSSSRTGRNRQVADPTGVETNGVVVTLEEERYLPWVGMTVELRVTARATLDLR